MNLSLNSPVSKLYRWFYATGQMPESLCPYFWKLVLMWIFIIPYIILSLPYMLFNYEFRHDEQLFRGSSIIEKPFVGFIGYGVLGVILSMVFSISIFWVVYPTDTFLMYIQTLGLSVWLIIISFGIWNSINWVYKKCKNRHIKYDEDGRIIWEPIKEKSDPIVWTFIKATYHKYCPKINWEQ